MHGTDPLISARKLFDSDFVNIVENPLLQFNVTYKFMFLQQASSDIYVSAVWSPLTGYIKQKRSEV
jgi:hypothetical protein